MKHVVFVLALVGCGGNHAASPDGSTAPPIDAPTRPIDGPPDGAAGSGSGSNGPALVVDDGVQLISAWSSVATLANTTSSARLFVLNQNATPTGALAPTITGADAASFSVGSAGTTCGPALQPGDGCWIQLQFAPATTGQLAATLALDGGNAALSLPLVGNAIAAPAGGLAAAMATIDFGDLDRGTTASAHVIVTNVSSSMISMTARTAPSPFIESDNCPAMLTPSGSCTITIGLPSSVGAGLVSGTLAVTSSAPELDIPLHAVVLRVVSVNVTGGGSGSVISLPSGIDCGSTCSADFPSDIAVSLTAAGSGGSIVAGFSGACSSNTPSCTLASPTDGLATANILPSTAHKIAIAMAGSSRSVAVVTGGGTSPMCTSDCAIYVNDGAEITVYAGSPSTFVGFTGDCVTTMHTCNLGTITADRSITITSNADANEVSTLLPATQITGLGVEPNGDLVIATPTGVSRVTLTGATVWTTAIGSASELAIDANGDVFGLGSNAVFALGSDGSTMWTRGFTGVRPLATWLDSTVGVKPDGTLVAVLESDGVHVVNGSGADIYTITGLSPAPQSVAVGSDGTVALIELDESEASDQTKALRYDATGTALATFPLLPGDEDSTIALDSTGAVCVVSSGEAEVTASRSTAPSTVAWQSSERVSSATTMPSGVLVDRSGEVAQINWVSQTSFGLELKLFSATGSVVLDQSKPVDLIQSTGIRFNDTVEPLFIATGGATNRIAIGGVYDDGISWIQVFDVP